MSHRRLSSLPSRLHAFSRSCLLIFTPSRLLTFSRSHLAYLLHWSPTHVLTLPRSRFLAYHAPSPQGVQPPKQISRRARRAAERTPCPAHADRRITLLYDKAVTTCFSDKQERVARRSHSVALGHNQIGVAARKRKTHKKNGAGLPFAHCAPFCGHIFLSQKQDVMGL